MFSTGRVSAEEKLNISLRHHSASEAQTEAQIRRLLKEYDLARWLFTRSIVIDEESIPHSHPVLTLHTRHLKDDELLLSTFVHEQLHWFLEQQHAATAAAVKDLEVLFPNVPVGFPEGADTKHASYEHLLVNYLEYSADKQLLGELRAREVMDFWSTDHYSWIYRTILERPRELGEIIAKHGLIPPMSHTKRSTP
jgi:hypothetical protein